MANTSKKMQEIRTILRLSSEGRSIHQISRDLNISRNTTRKYIRACKESGKSFPHLSKLSDEQLSRIIFADKEAVLQKTLKKLKEQFPYFEKELSRVGVTRQLLWKEFLQGEKAAISYSRFCFHLSQFKRSSNVVMHLQHTPGEALMLDYTGKKLHYFDPLTGEQIDCEVFIATFPYSNYSFAIAVRSQKQSDFLHALACSLNYFGGVPKKIIPDNLKSAVKRTDRYEPTFPELMNQCAAHYDLFIEPGAQRARTCH